MHITPFLALVLTGFALFIGVLGTVWLQSAADSLKMERKPRT